MSAPVQVITLGVVDAEELAELLEFAAEFLRSGEAELGFAYRRWTRCTEREHSLGELVEDLEGTASRLRCAPVVTR